MYGRWLYCLVGLIFRFYYFNVLRCLCTLALSRIKFFLYFLILRYAHMRLRFGFC